jgi:hypothetical protein
MLGERCDQPFVQFVRDRFPIGDAAFCREEILCDRAVLGVNPFILRLPWSGLEQAKVLRTLDLLGSEVLAKLG